MDEQSSACQLNKCSETVVSTKTQILAKTANANTSNTNRFADYFVICGLDLDTGLEPDRFAGMFFF